MHDGLWVVYGNAQPWGGDKEDYMIVGCSMHERTSGVSYEG